MIIVIFLFKNYSVTKHSKLNLLFFYLGILLMYCTGLYLHWRIVAWIAFVGAFFPVLMTAFWTPESPVWLIHKGQDIKALKSLKYFKNSKYVSYFQLHFLQFVYFYF